jgi:uncharacterized protein YjdB
MTSRKPVFIGIALVIALATLVACNEHITKIDPDEVPVATLDFAPLLDTLEVGDSLIVLVTPRDVDNNALSRTVRFTSKHPTIASIDSITGKVHALSIGSATLEAAVGEVTKSGVLVVIASQKPATITVSPETPSVQVGSTVTLTAVAKNATGDVVAATFGWATANPAIATVNASTGVVTGVAAGTVNMTATAGGITGSVSVTVTPPPVDNTVATVTVAPSTPSVGVGLTLVLTATARNAGGAVLVGAPIAWSTNAPAIATVNASTGTVTGVSVGTATITALSGVASGTAQVTVTAVSTKVATLPQLQVNTTYTPPTGRALIVAAGGNFQTALDTALAGDEILLAAGATYSGNFTLRKKAGSSPIHIRTNIPIGSLPAPGTRMTPSLAASLNLAKIVGASGSSIIASDRNASNYRFVGVEVTVTAGATSINSLLRMGQPNETNVDSLSSNMIVDRSYMHGSATCEVIRAVLIGSRNSAVIDSWLSDIHSTGFDAQAIVAWNTTGQIKVENNYLEGSGENMMVGGADPDLIGVIPSDIEVLRNHFNKPTSWIGTPIVVKNLFELKSGVRVLVEGNVMTGSWQSGQTGFAVNIKASTGAAQWITTKDVTFRYNKISNAGAGMTLAGKDQAPVDSVQRRITVRDNVFDNINISPNFVGAGNLLQIVAGNIDILLDHNTFVSSGQITSAVIFDGAPTTSSTVSNNIFMRGDFGMKGSGTSEGTNTLATYMPGVVFTKNAVIGAPAASYPAGNFFPADAASAGFESFAGRLYTILSGSLLNAGSDGRSVGADIATLNTKIAGVVINP